MKRTAYAAIVFMVALAAVRAVAQQNVSVDGAPRESPPLPEQQIGLFECCIGDECVPLQERCGPPLESVVPGDVPVRNSEFIVARGEDESVIGRHIAEISAQDAVGFVGKIRIIGVDSRQGVWLDHEGVVITECKFDIVEAVKDVGSIRSFNVLGGTLPDGSRHVASHQPDCAVGDEVLVMLTRINGAGYLASARSAFMPMNTGAAWIDGRSLRLLRGMTTGGRQ